jgi:hypothetical protein
MGIQLIQSGSRLSFKPRSLTEQEMEQEHNQQMDREIKKTESVANELKGQEAPYKGGIAEAFYFRFIVPVLIVLGFSSLGAQKTFYDLTQKIVGLIKGFKTSQGDDKAMLAIEEAHNQLMEHAVRQAQRKDDSEDEYLYRAAAIQNITHQLSSREDYLYSSILALTSLIKAYDNPATAVEAKPFLATQMSFLIDQISPRN